MFSTWNKIDLHIHTDMSNLTKSNDYQGNFSIDTLCENIRKCDVRLISLTDHNIVNCNAYDELSKKNIEYLVGMELDVSITSTDLKNYVNKLKQNTGDKIDIKPFHALVLFRTKDHNKISSELENMYRTISKDLLDGCIDLEIEKKLRVTTIEYIVKFFRNEDFFIIAHGNKDKGIVEPYKKVKKVYEAQNEILIGGISALEMKSNANMENVINHYNEDFQKLMRNDFKTTKATSYVVFSDNHNCEEYHLRSKETWIKGQPTFETLRLAFSDPESRIHSSEHEPITNTNFIDSMQICINGHNPQQIDFSPQLNVIIGGRSSGKSLLFNTLVNLNNEFTENDKKIYKKSYSKLVDLDNCNAKLSIGSPSSTISIHGEAFYQEAIISLFEEENDLKSKLEDEFIEILDSDIRTIENQLDDTVAKFNTAYKNYYEISSKIDKGDIKEHLLVSLRKSDKLFSIDIDKIASNKNLETYSHVINELVSMNEKLIDLGKKIVDDKNIFTATEQHKINEVAKLLLSKKSEIEIKRQNEEIRQKFIDRVKAINRQYVLTELTSEKQLIEQTKNKLANDINDYNDFFKSKLRLRKACDQIESINKKIDDKINTKSKYKFVTKVNLNISGKKIVQDFFEDKIIGYLPNRSLFQNMLNFACFDLPEIRIKQFPADGKTPERLNNSLTSYIRNIKSKKSYEIIECCDNGVEISTLSTSQGKKASIFLDIKLKNLCEEHNKSVLFIDQLEDNIDNRFISEELVSIIRQLKKTTQIILVTHNPSIAIYGDAENIIIAENTGTEITYKQGGLENIEIRKEACKILDGGEIAFKNRIDKYNIAVIKETS